MEDPNAPHPVGPTMQPAVGVPLESRQDWHRNLEAAIQHHSTTLSKHPAFSVVEPNGKVQVHANYSEHRVIVVIVVNRVIVVIVVNRVIVVIVVNTGLSWLL